MQLIIHDKLLAVEIITLFCSTYIAPSGYNENIQKNIVLFIVSLKDKIAVYRQQTREFLNLISTRFVFVKS